MSCQVSRRNVWPGRAHTSAGTLLPASTVTCRVSRALGPTVQSAPTMIGPRLSLPLRVISWHNRYAPAPKHAPSPSTTRSSSGQ
eukprot:scaffold37810_cov69-Phaeocystis_antarctica.AAC.2